MPLTRSASIALLASLLLGIRALGASEVKTLSEEWHDAKRDRDVPVKVYYPVDLDNKSAPVIIFSHGLGGSRDGYAFLGNTWASAGYISVHLQHIGSDDSLWRDGKPGKPIDKVKSGMTLQAYLDRVGDVRFAIDQLQAINNLDAGSKHALAGKLDLKHIAMAGHSFGAQTTQAIAGQIAVFGKREIGLADDRITCAIALSPAPPKAPADVGKAFSKMRVPILWMTGTNDTGVVRETKADERLVPYEKTTAKDQYLVVFTDADHMAFAGGGAMAKKISASVELTTTAFLDAYLRNEADKKKTLTDDLRKIVGDAGTVKSK